MDISAKNIIEKHLLLTVAIVSTIVIYLNFLWFGHISWDDPEMVFKNEAVKHFDVKAFFTGNYVGNYIPITMLLHGLTWSLFEDSNAAHHLVNILIHLLNGLLVYQLGRILFKNQIISGFGALIFLLHPMQVESVGWISELKNVLYTFFYLLSILFYLEYREDKKLKNYLYCIFLFVFACLSKSAAVVLPIILLCLDIFIDHKINIKQVFNKLPLLAISIVIGLVNIKMQTEAQFINHSHEFPIFQRIALAGFAVLKYVLIFLTPVKLSVIYPYPEIKLSVIVTGVIVILALLFLIFFFIRKQNYRWLAVLLFVLVNLSLVLQLLPFGEVLYADRYLYVPMIGLGWMMGAFVSAIKIPKNTIGLIFILLFSILTYSRISVWKSAINLYEDIIKKYPENFVALNSAGVESMFINEDGKALEYFDRATTVAPRNYKAFYNRGLLFLKNNKPQQAIQSFNETIGMYEYGKAYTGRASAYYLMNDISKAMTDANKAIELDEKNSKAHFVLANCYNDLNRLNDALNEYNKAIMYNNLEPDYYFKRAITFGKQQNFASCISDLEVCISLNPAYYEAYYWRGVAKVNLNQDPCPDLRVAARYNFQPAVIAVNKYCR